MSHPLSQLENLPDFQKLQVYFTNHIRDPKNTPFLEQNLPGLAARHIEPRRLKVYEELFFNNLRGFFTSLFPVLTSILGDLRVDEVIREYLQKHQSRTPLFHELGQEFLSFFQNEFTPKESDPPFLLELAHYEWVEVAVAIETLEGPLNAEEEKVGWQQVYHLSPVAWPLTYQWPVHLIDSDNFAQWLTPPEWGTAILVYRDDEDAVQFMELSPVLYELLIAFMDNEQRTVSDIVESLAQQTQQPIESLKGFAESILNDLIAQNIISSIETSH